MNILVNLNNKDILIPRINLEIGKRSYKTIGALLSLKLLVNKRASFGKINVLNIDGLKLVKSIEEANKLLSSTPIKSDIKNSKVEDVIINRDKSDIKNSKVEDVIINRDKSADSLYADEAQDKNEEEYKEEPKEEPKEDLVEEVSENNDSKGKEENEELLEENTDKEKIDTAAKKKSKSRKKK
jgi:hypothetical protein